jgi:hypothetical protein
MAELPEATPAIRALRDHRTNLILLGQIAQKLGRSFGDQGTEGLEQRFWEAIGMCRQTRDRYSQALFEARQAQAQAEQPRFLWVRAERGRLMHRVARDTSGIVTLGLAIPGLDTLGRALCGATPAFWTRPKTHHSGIYPDCQSCAALVARLEAQTAGQPDQDAASSA